MVSPAAPGRYSGEHATGGINLLKMSVWLPLGSHVHSKARGNLVHNLAPVVLQEQRMDYPFVPGHPEVEMTSWLTLMIQYSFVSHGTSERTQSR